jgi:hypothetical protein
VTIDAENRRPSECHTAGRRGRLGHAAPA